VEAVLCAAEIQQEVSLRDADPPEQRIQLRIGINIGDVIRKGNDVFGTGVNIAARRPCAARRNTWLVQSADLRHPLPDAGLAVSNAGKEISAFSRRASVSSAAARSISRLRA
jgi:class 3 adenylate cyclase